MDSSLERVTGNDPFIGMKDVEKAVVGCEMG